MKNLVHIIFILLPIYNFGQTPIQFICDTINVDTVNCPIYSDCARQGTYNYKNIGNEPVSIVKVTGNGAGTGSYPKTPILPNESSQINITFWRFPQENGSFILRCIHVEWVTGTTYFDKQLYIKGYRKIPLPNLIKNDKSKIAQSFSKDEYSVAKIQSSEQTLVDSSKIGITSPIFLDDCQTIYLDNKDSTYCHKNGELSYIEIIYKKQPNTVSSKIKEIFYENNQIKSSRTDTWYCKRRIFKMPKQTRHKVRLVREIFENGLYKKTESKWHNEPISHPS